MANSFALVAAAAVSAASPAPPPQDQVGAGLACAQSNPSALIAGFGILVTVILFWLGARRNRMEATFEALRMLQDKDARNARFNLPSLLGKAREHADNFPILTPDEQAAQGFASLAPEERAAISSIATQFGFIGALAKRRRIYRSILFDSFASSIVTNHLRLRDYAKWRRSRRPLSEGTGWTTFDWLANRAERFLLIRAEPSLLRRLLARCRLRSPDISLLDALRREAKVPRARSASPATPSKPGGLGH